MKTKVILRQTSQIKATGWFSFPSVYIWPDPVSETGIKYLI